MNPMMALLNDSSKFKWVESSLFTNLDNIKGAPYDNKAKMYERLVSSKWYNQVIWGTQPSDYTDFAREVVLNAQGLCLDIGCGGLVQTAQVYVEAQQPCILLDNSIEMLKIAKQRLINLVGKVPDNIQLLQANAFQLPFEDNTFDNIFSFGMIHLFDNKLEYIKEALRVLKTGGRFYFSSLTSDRLIGKLYIYLLQTQKEFGQALNSKQTLELFKTLNLNIQHYQKGSMVFINGKK